MKRSLYVFVVAALLVSDAYGQEKKKPAAFTRAEDAGADFEIQGEYEGDKLGAQVVALGDGKFDCYFLGGGLPGKGWDQKTRVKATGTASVSGGGWSGEIAGGKLKGRNAEGAEFALSKVMRKSPTEGEKPPAGAVVLFDGSNADAWAGGKIVEENLLRMGTNSKEKFGNVKLHIEFRTSFMPHARGQGRANSGVYLAGRHESQVLDSFGLTGENNECGGIYSIRKPDVNMCFPPLSWQTFDIEYRLATTENGARMTVLHNGVKVHDNVEITKKTTAAVDKNPDTTPGPIHLQDHGNPIVFRNIWVVALK